MFYDFELDLCPGYGWQGGPSFNTRIKPLRNGHERRSVKASLARHMYTLPFQNILEQVYLDELKAAFLAARGSGHSFKVKDRSDYRAVNASLGNAPTGSAAVQLKKTSTFGVATYSRTITKPKAVTVYQSGIAKPGTVNSLTGMFTPTTAWTAGLPLTWTGEFFVPVRFDNDSLPMSIDNRTSGGYVMNGSVQLIEVFGE